jgi:hypothetical protein
MKPQLRFVVALTKLATVFRVDMTDVLIESYWDALNEWPIEGLEGGARTIIRESKFFPRPVEWSDAAEDWLKERRSMVDAHRLALQQSNQPPLTKDDVKKLIAELNEKMGGGR